MSSVSALKSEFEAVHAAAYAEGKTEAELEELGARRSELFGLLLAEGWAPHAPPKSSSVSFVEIPKPASTIDFDALVNSPFMPGVSTARGEINVPMDLSGVYSRTHCAYLTSKPDVAQKLGWDLNYSFICGCAINDERTEMKGERGGSE